MLISYKYKFIFIHIPKNAGNSIRKALVKYSELPYESLPTKLLQVIKLKPASSNFNGHVSAKDIRKKIGDEQYENFFKFAFVRNPWDRLVSTYEYILQTKPHPQHNLVKAMGSFENFVEYETRSSNQGEFQKGRVTDERGELIVDFIGRYESLSSDFMKICEIIGINEELPHLNSSKKRESYLEYYNPKNLNLVAEKFRDEIELFGYDVPETDMIH